MHSIKKILAVSALQWFKTFRRTHFWIVIVLVPLLAYRYMNPVLRFSQSTGVNVTPVGIAFFLSDYGVSLIYCLGLILLFAQAPFMDEQMTYVLMRCENGKWYWGTLLYSLSLACGYMLYWCVCLLLPIATNIEWSSDWGKIWNTLCQTSAYYEVEIAVKMPYALLAYNGGTALILSIALKLIYSWMISCIMLIFNTPWRIPFGTTASILLMLQDYFAMNGRGYAYYWYSPATMSRLSMLDSTDTFLQPCPEEAICVLISIVAVVGMTGWLICRVVDINKNTRA